MAESCTHPPLPFDEHEVVEALLQCHALEKSGRYMPASVELGPYTAYILISVLQLCWRHPDLSVSQREIIESIARPLQVLFESPLSDSLELGWQTGYDVSRPSRETS